MKRSILNIFIVITILSTLFLANTVPVNAETAPTPQELPNLPELGYPSGSWTSGTSINGDTSGILPPVNWVQLLGKPVKISASTDLCLPFPGGQFGWVGSIYRSTKTGWELVPTSTGWMPNKEGSVMACAEVPASGTYALFAYFTRPPETGPDKILPACTDQLFTGGLITVNGPFSGEGLEIDPAYQYFLDFDYDASLEDDIVILEIISFSPSENPVYLVNNSGDIVSTKQKTLRFWDKQIVLYGVSNLTDMITIRIATDTCYQDISFIQD